MEHDKTTRGPRPSQPPRKRFGAVGRLRLGAVLAVAVAIGFAVWLLVRDNGASKPKPQKTTTAVLSKQGLRTVAGAVSTPVYWAGPQSGVRYELTQTPNARVFVRYLPAGAPVGSSKQYLFVGTLPVANAFAVTQRAARKSGSVTIGIGSGGIAFYTRSLRTNVYIAFPGTNYQIEVFDPDANEAHRLVANGAIEPLLPSAGPTTAQSTVLEASLTDLRALPAKLGHPVYWAGSHAGGTYELTQTPSGRVFVRYLPAGATVGGSTPHLFVATFPLKNAFAVTQKAAQGAGSVAIPVAGGAIAFYSKSSPTNVYLAFPGSEYQIEVFDPNPQHGHTLVRSGKVQPISP